MYQRSSLPVTAEMIELEGLMITTTLIEMFWSNLTFKQQSSWIYHSAGTPMLVLSTLARNQQLIFVCAIRELG
jgi:uncharacterized membrane protein